MHSTVATLSAVRDIVYQADLLHEAGRKKPSADVTTPEVGCKSSWWVVMRAIRHFCYVLENVMLGYMHNKF